jgi:enhancing lycopene biosynthesis protein 2
MAKRIGVLLSGCGVLDGSEIHEAVLTLLAIDNAGAEAVCIAPNADQMHVVNHVTGEPVAGERRNMLVEAARIARGNIRDAATVEAGDLDALILPGGYGAVKNLCSYAVDGRDCRVRPEVERLLRQMHEAGKPIGAICIAPVIVARIFGAQGAPEITIGTDAATAGDVQAMGATHVNCPVREFVADEANRLVTTPAYMLARSIGEAAAGIEKAVRAVIQMTASDARAHEAKQAAAAPHKE